MHVYSVDGMWRPTVYQQSSTEDYVFKENPKASTNKNLIIDGLCLWIAQNPMKRTFLERQHVSRITEHKLKSLSREDTSSILSHLRQSWLDPQPNAFIMVSGSTTMGTFLILSLEFDEW